jgi:hypothetical protein
MEDYHIDLCQDQTGMIRPMYSPDIVRKKDFVICHMSFAFECMRCIVTGPVIWYE